LPGKNAEVVARMPSLLRTVVVPYLDPAAGVGAVANAVSWRDLPTVAADAEVRITRVAFDHPLFIMFSSGTTGVPKCIVHCHGGVLLQHLKEHQLHSDVRPGDRLFYFTTCGWMMWNWLVSGLACGATLLLYDGSPFAARARFCSTTQPPRNDPLRHLGQVHRRRRQARPDRARRTTWRPARHVLDRQPAVAGRASTGYIARSSRTSCSLRSPAAPTSCPASCSATRCCRCIAAKSSAAGWAWRSMCSTTTASRCVGEGRAGGTRPFPVMPVGFWNDPDGAKYAAYFERFPTSGAMATSRADRARRHDHLRPLRCDLNPGGVRIGTAEIYRQVEQLPEILESLVIGQDWPPGKNDDVRVVLFVKLQEGQRSMPR
jgi:acetoacetyl-CoA synthetase